jgi:ERCC4-type nuclease
MMKEASWNVTNTGQLHERKETYVMEIPDSVAQLKQNMRTAYRKCAALVTARREDMKKEKGKGKRNTKRHQYKWKTHIKPMTEGGGSRWK